MKKYLKYILLILVIVFCFLLYYNTDLFHSKNKSNTEITKIIKKNKDITQELREKYNNDDIIGTISVVNTDINEVLLQTTNNRYYLTHDNYGNYDKYGSVFLDHRCNKDSKKILVFGHNDFKEETPFSNLENYYDKDYYVDHQFIDVIINNTKTTYQIFSIYVETEDFTYMNLKIDDNQYTYDLNKYKNKSFYDTNVSVSSDDRILILQTLLFFFFPHPPIKTYVYKPIILPWSRD